jgi:hypothetical protein
MMFDTKYFNGITGFLKGLSTGTAQANTTADDAAAVAGQANKTAASALTKAGAATDAASTAKTAADAATAAAVSAADAASSAKAAADALAKTQVYVFQVTTGADGTAVVDYSSLKLASAPRVAFMPQLAAADLPVIPDILGSPTKTSCTVRVRRLTSILNLGLLTSYSGVANLKLDVYVRPMA